MAKRRTAEEWSVVVERWQRSGVSAKEFAAAEGLVASTLSWWKYHLAKKRVPKKAVVEKAAPRRRRKKRMQRARKAGENAEPIRLVELVAPRASAAASEAPLELVLGGDVVVRIQRGFDAETLRRLLAVFRSEDTQQC